MAAALGPYIAVSGVRGGVRWFGLGVEGAGNVKHTCAQNIKYLNKIYYIQQILVFF